MVYLSRCPTGPQAYRTSVEGRWCDDDLFVCSPGDGISQLQHATLGVGIHVQLSPPLARAGAYQLQRAVQHVNSLGEGCTFPRERCLVTDHLEGGV